jgi:hypothetical protein
MPKLNALSDTFNDGGSDLHSIDLNVTDTASGAESSLIRLRKDSVDRFRVTKEGRADVLGATEKVNIIGAIGGGTQDIDLDLGAAVTCTVDTSTTTFTFSNPSATGLATSFTMIITNGGSQTVNWPASVDWAGGTAPTLTTSGRDVLTFLTVDGGTIWYGFNGGLDFS